jgi:avidin family protein
MLNDISNRGDLTKVTSPFSLSLARVFTRRLGRMTIFSNRWIVFRICAICFLFLALTDVIGQSRTTHRARGRAVRAAAFQAPGSTTKWQNERGSTMVLISDGNGNLTGEYTTAVGCPAVVGKPQKLVGTTNGSAITFTVNWGKAPCRSLTSWVGQLESPTRINTLWLLALDNNDPKSFKVTYAGSDLFTRTSP